MSDTHHPSSWHTLPNPFLNRTKQPVFTGFVSGRSADIREIIMGEQSAILLAGAPHIGKSALIRYLQNDCGGWSWRDELKELSLSIELEDIHFAQIGLTPLETETEDSFLKAFQKQCALTVQSMYYRNKEHEKQTFTLDLKGLRELLRHESRENPEARYFVMLDAIERLGRMSMQHVNEDNRRVREQDKGLVLLQERDAIHTLVDLNDEFSNFGTILTIEVLPLPSLGHQFSHTSPYLSADLARFTTMTLKAFTWEDAIRFLQQPPESFGQEWVNQFRALQASNVFSPEEQTWLLEQAGTHPYLLQQVCFHAFSWKQKRASLAGKWSDLEDADKGYIVDTVNERLNTFLTNIWKRLQEALAESKLETGHQFYKFLFAPKAKPNTVIAGTTWNACESQLRYILSTEGIVCFDGMQQVRYPGSVLLHFLIQQIQEGSEQMSTGTASSLSPRARNYLLAVTMPEGEPTHVPLSELEYRLMQTLLQHPLSCTEDTLMMGAWGKKIKHSSLGQRIYQLRKKLENYLGGDIDFIGNRYGGVYYLNHPEWLRLEPE